jgi:hypothetical protein
MTGKRATISSQYISISSYAAIVFSSLTTCSTYEGKKRKKNQNQRKRIETTNKYIKKNKIKII